MTNGSTYLARGNVILLTLALVIFTWALWIVPINHDSAFIFLAAERFLDGQRLYLDQSLISPPLGFWMYAGVVLVDRWLGPLGVHAVLPFVVTTIALSLALGGQVLNRVPGISNLQQVALLWAAFIALAIAPIADLAQRDHLFAVFALPYVLVQGLRFDRVKVPRELALAVGVFAFFGLALKPYFLLLPLLLEIAVLIRSRRLSGLFRPETVALGTCLGLYALSVVVLYPEYFTTVLPRYTSVFSAFTLPLILLIQMEEVILAVFAVAVISIKRSNTEAGKGVIVAVLVATLAAVIIFLLQKKGWSYQRAPALVFAAMLMFMYLLLAKKTGLNLRSLDKFAMVLGLAGIAWLLYVRGPYSNAYQNNIAGEMARMARGQAAYVFTTNVSVPYPTFLYYGVTPASRFNTLWMIPALARYGPSAPAVFKSIETFTRDAILQDFQRYKPKIVGIDVRKPKPYFNGKAFNYLRWALNDPRFAAEWKAYVPVKYAYGFIIYRRRPGAK